MQTSCAVSIALVVRDSHFLTKDWEAGLRACPPKWKEGRVLKAAALGGQGVSDMVSTSYDREEGTLYGVHPGTDGTKLRCFDNSLFGGGGKY